MTLETGFVDLLVRSSLLIALAWGATTRLQKTRGSAAMRHLIWLLALASLLLIPLLSALMPRLPLPILPETAGPTAVAPVPAAAAAIAAPTASASTIAPEESIGLGDLAQLLYLAVVAGLLGRLALGHALLARLWRRSTPLDDPASTDLLARLSSSLAIGRPVAIRIAAGPAMPMTWGSLRPRILLPADAHSWDEERLRIVLLHELAHVARHDSLSRTGAAMVCALYWCNPAVWYAVRQMRREQEHACDDLVLTLGARPSVYARNLLDAAHAFHAPRVVGTLSVAMASPSELERRLTAIVTPGSRRRASVRFLVGCGATALVATSLAASVVPVPADSIGVSSSSTTKPIRRSAASLERAPNVRAAAAAARSSALAPVRSPPSTILPIAASPEVPPVSPVPATPTSIAPTAPASGRGEFDYDRALAEYHGDLRAYHAAERHYNRELALYNRKLGALSRTGNLASSGNSGNSGNTGNPGHPGRHAQGDVPAIPAIPPIPPIMPTLPTSPTPLKPPQQGP